MVYLGLVLMALGVVGMFLSDDTRLIRLGLVVGIAGLILVMLGAS